MVKFVCSRLFCVRIIWGRVIYLFLDGSGCNDVQEDTAYKTPNDIVYMRLSCQSGMANRCAHCVNPYRPQQWKPDLPFLDKPDMQTRLMAGTAPHKSGRC